MRAELVKMVEVHLQNGFSFRQVLAQVHLTISHGTVQKIATMSRIERSLMKGGRSSKLSASAERDIVCSITFGECDTAADAARHLQSVRGIAVNPQAIGNVLKTQRLKALHKVKTPAISSTNRKKRLDFARRHQRWTLADWSRQKQIQRRTNVPRSSGLSTANA